MDFVKKMTGSEKEPAPESGTTSTSTAAKQGGGGGITGKFNEMAGGGQKGERNEDALDKGVDWAQEHVLGQGPQDNESAFEQKKDEMISDSIRGGYRSATGKEFPVRDK